MLDVLCEVASDIQETLGAPRADGVYIDSTTASGPT
jgi:hypothetical protein